MYQQNFDKWFEADLPQVYHNELVAMADDENLKKEAFSMPLAFGTAGMRGVLGMGISRMNIYTVSRATEGLARLIESKGAQDRGVLIGYDTRHGSFLFATTTAKVLEQHGIKVYLYEDVRPVPQVSFGVRELGCIAGVMITASHNPKEYNGYKVYGEDGAQLDLEDSDTLTKIISGIEEYIGIPTSATNLNEDIKGLDGVEVSRYITVVGASLDKKFYQAVKSLLLYPEAKGQPMKVVYTPLHGAGMRPVMRMLADMGIAVNLIDDQATPDGDFPTVAVPNPENSEALSMAIDKAVLIGADAVIATDPDCDRMGVACLDKAGGMTLISGNATGALLTDYVLSRKRELGRLTDKSVIIKSIVTTELARKVAEGYGVGCIDVLTGFKFFGEKIKEWEISHEYEYEFGYEESYGYLGGTHARDKDAVSASMLFAEMLAYYKSKGVSVLERLEEIYRKYGYYKDLSISVVYKGLDGMQIMADKMEVVKALNPTTLGGYKVVAVSDFSKGTKTHIDGKVEPLPQAKSNVVKFFFENGDWCCVRPSGTEPKLKYYISASAPTMAEAQRKFDNIAQELSKYVNN